MKFWKQLLIPVMVLGLAGVVEAKGTKGAGKGAAKEPAVKGKIVSIAADGTSIVVKTGKKNGGEETTVTTNANTNVEIDGVKGKAVMDLEVGEVVNVKSASGAASEIKAHKGKHGEGKKKSKPV